jgi:septum formation protein
MKNIILASESSDRKKILSRARIPFTAISSNVDESVLKERIKDPIKLVQKLAKAKVLNVKKGLTGKEKECYLIGADTIVEFQGKIIGKAINREEAFKTLKKLSGNTHNLITGLAITKSGEEKTFTDYDKTKVSFLSLSESEIWNYIDTGEWKGRAGAYSIQDRASLFIKSIKGSPSNVIGLPLHKVFQIFKLKFSINLIRS